MQCFLYGPLCSRKRIIATSAKKIAYAYLTIVSVNIVNIIEIGYSTIKLCTYTRLQPIGT